MSVRAADTYALVAAISLIACVGVGLSLTLPLLSLEMERMAVSGSAIGFSSALAGLSSIAVAPFIPRWAARYGVGRLLLAALILSTLALIGFKLTMNYWAWLPLRLVYALGLGTLFILSEFWISAKAPPAQRGMVMGIYATVLSIGFAAGPTLLAVVGTSGWAPYLAGLALFAVAAMPLLLARRHLPAIENRPRRPLARYLVAAPLAAAAGFASGAVETGAMSMLPVLGLRLGFDASQAALLVSAVALGNILAQVPIGWLSDRFDRRRLLLVMALGVIAANALQAALAVPGSLAIYVVLVLWGAFAGAFYTLGLAHLAARFALADLVAANAAFVVMFNVGLLAGPPLIGAGVDASPRLGFAVTTSVFAAVVVAMSLYEARRATVARVT